VIVVVVVVVAVVVAFHFVFVSKVTVQPLGNLGTVTRLYE
jgi:hypothetical protein